MDGLKQECSEDAGEASTEKHIQARGTGEHRESYLKRFLFDSFQLYFGQFFFLQS